MSYTKIQTLLALNFYQMTGEEIGKLKAQYPNKAAFEERVLPKWTLNTDTGEIVETAYYLHWIDSGEESYLLFNAKTADEYLDVEISDKGLDGLLEDIDLRPTFEFLTKEFNDINTLFMRVPPRTKYIVLGLIYTSSFDGESTEYDFEIELEGYMDGLKFIPINEYGKTKI